MHGGSIGIDEVDICQRHTAVMQKSEGLFHHYGDLGVDLETYLIAHEQGSEQLQQRDLDGEVEGGDDDNWSKRPSTK